MGRFKEDSADFILLLGIIALESAPFLVELPFEVGMCLPPQLIERLLPVVQEFGLGQATGIYMGHKVVYLVLVGDCDPMVFALSLAPVQLACKGGDMSFWSVAPWREEVGFDSQILLGDDNIPRAELGNQCLGGMFFVTYVVLPEFLDELCVDGRNNGFNCHQVKHLLEGVILPIDILIHLDMEELLILGNVLNSWVDELWFLETLAVQVVVPCSRSHLGPANDEWE